MNKQAGAKDRERAAASAPLRDVATWPGAVAIKIFFPATEGNHQQRAAWIRGWDEAGPEDGPSLPEIIEELREIHKRSEWADVVDPVAEVIAERSEE